MNTAGAVRRCASAAGGQPAIDRRALAAAFGGQAAYGADPPARRARLPRAGAARARPRRGPPARAPSWCPRGRDHLGLHPRAVADGHATPRPDAQRPRPAPHRSALGPRRDARRPRRPRRRLADRLRPLAQRLPRRGRLVLPPPRGLVHPAGRQPQLRLLDDDGSTASSLEPRPPGSPRSVPSAGGRSSGRWPPSLPGPPSPTRSARTSSPRVRSYVAHQLYGFLWMRARVG